MLYRCNRNVMVTTPRASCVAFSDAVFPYDPSGPQGGANRRRCIRLLLSATVPIVSLLTNFLPALAEPKKNLGILVGETARLWRYVLDQRLQPLGLSQAKWLVLLHLSRQDGLTQKELALRVGVEPPTLAGLLDRMAADGWVTRRESSADRRRKNVQLTPKSLETLKRIRATGSRLRRELLAGIPRKDLERCAAVLERIKRAVEKVLQ